MQKRVVMMVHPSGDVVSVTTKAEFLALRADGWKPVVLQQSAGR